MVKQVVGIDVAQKELVVCLGRMSDDWFPELYAGKAFANSVKGFELLEKCENFTSLDYIYFVIFFLIKLCFNFNILIF